MAIVHEERHDDRVYQIRSAGASLRLYTNGVFHSQYSTSPRATASVWELLAMSALLIEPPRLSRVLMLGVGGGAVPRLISERFDAPHITGIELDPVHISLAKRFFDLDRPNIELVQADARHWVEGYRGETFDLIIDDLFGDMDGVPRRNLECDHEWLAKLGAMLSTHGVLAANFADLPEFRRSAMSAGMQAGDRWAGGYSLRLDTLENVVAVLCRTTTATTAFRRDITTRFGPRTAARCSLRRLQRVGPSRGPLTG